MINQQSAARSTSSRKQHKTICQLRTNATALFPVDRGKRPQQQRRQRHHRNSKALLPHCRLFPINYSRGKEPPTDAIPGLVSSVDTAYAAYYTTFAWRSLSTETTFLLVYIVEKLFPDSWYTLPLAISQTKSVCNRAHQCVCCYSYLYYLHE